MVFVMVCLSVDKLDWWIEMVELIQLAFLMVHLSVVNLDSWIEMVELK